MLCETQSVSSRIWTRVAVSISYNDNHYTTGTLPHIIHTVLSGRCVTLDDDGLSMWDFIWFTYPAFERRTRLYVSQIQFAWSHGKFSRFPFLSSLFNFTHSNLLTWREPQPVLPIPAKCHDQLQLLPRCQHQYPHPSDCFWGHPCNTFWAYAVDTFKAERVV